MMSVYVLETQTFANTNGQQVVDAIMSNFGIHLITILLDWYIEVLINLWMTLYIS